MAAITLESMPPIPEILLRVMRFDPEQEQSDVQALEQLIRPDKGMSTRLLKIANSSFYGRSGKIGTLREAITLLGLKAVKNLVVMISTQGLAAQLRDPAYRTYLQEYPVLSALVAMDLCGPAKQRPLVEQSFTCALLASIGMTVIALNRPEHYCVILDTAHRSPKMALLDLEEESYRTNHCLAGIMACEAWKLPADFREVIQARTADWPALEESSDLVRLVMLADTIVRRLMSIPDPRGRASIEPLLAESLGISAEQLAAFSAEYFEALKDHPFYENALGG